MKRRLFLTGPIGCGKSTAIAKALGEKTAQCGGFLTRRHRERGLFFTLESADGQICQTFLDFPEGAPRLDITVFSGLGVSFLKGKVLVLDEIGGIELLCPEFTDALEALLESDTPILGVIKGAGPAGALMDALGLSDAYLRAADNLRSRLQNDENTLLYTCNQFDEYALQLAEQWAEEYLHD